MSRPNYEKNLNFNFMDVSAPQQPSYGQQMSDTLLAQEQAQTGTGDFSKIGPLLQLEQNPNYGKAAWANLDLQTANSVLNGMPANTTTGQPATPGLMAISNQVAQQQAASNAQALTTQRLANAADVARLGPQMMTAVNESDPASAALIGSMTTQAQQGLDMGSQLNPQQTRTVTQAVRNQNNGMLGGTGNAGDYSLALGMSSYGQQLQNNRRQFASTTLGQRQQFYQNPMWNVMGMPSTATPQTYTGQAQGITAGSYNPFNPESQMASNIYGSNQQAQGAAQAEGLSATMGLLTGGMSMLGEIGQGAFNRHPPGG